MSFLLGDGRQLSELESSLKDSISHYNSNFRKLALFDDQVIDSFQNLEKVIESLVFVELNLQEQLSELSRFTRLNNIKMEYLMTKLQHEMALHRLLVGSKLDENLNLLERALFGSNHCKLDLCETAISHELLGTKIKIHREIVTLQPIQLYLISCRAKDATMVPIIHNSLAESTISGSYLIDSQLYTKESLVNASFVNSLLHPLPEAEKLLSVFHPFANYSSLFIQCLKSTAFTLNEKLVQCEILESFSFPEDFEIVYNGKTLKSQKLIEEKHKVKLAWQNDYVFSNIDPKPLPSVPSLTILHPTLERFFFTSAGEVNITHVSYLGSTVFVIIIMIFLCCCWKNDSFRKFFISKTELLINWTYTLMTTETYRLQKETETLDKEIDKSWNELKPMEDVIAKKQELKRKLPVPSQKEPSTTQEEPSAPPLTSSKVSCDVHQEPTAPRYTTRPSSSARGHK